MAFLNPSLLSDGLVGLDTATPLADFQQLRQKRAESKALMNKSNAESDASEYDQRLKRFELLQRLGAASAANPTVANYAAQGNMARDFNLISPEEHDIYQQYAPQDDADVPANAAGKALWQMKDGGQIKAMEPTRSTLNLNDRQVVVSDYPVSHQQRIEGQYRMGVNPSYFTSPETLPKLAQQNSNPDPRIYGGDGLGNGQGTAPQNQQGVSQQPSGSRGDMSPPMMSLADLYATSQASGHPPQHVMRMAKAKGYRVMR